MQITHEELTALVSVAKAHGVRAAARLKAKQAKAAIAPAEEELRHFGMYEDCGDFYQTMVDEAKGVFSAAVASEIGAEKAYKKARLTAIERHPSLEGLIETYVNAGPTGNPVPAEA